MKSRQKTLAQTYTRKMTYIDIPFLAHLAFGRDRGLQFFVHAGPQISFLIGESETISGVNMDQLIQYTESRIRS